jgi:hypothetical protein
MCLQRALEKYITGAALDRAALDSYPTGLHEHKQMPAIKALSIGTSFMGEEE